MANPNAIAPNFRNKGKAKEFIAPDGKSYLVVRFHDHSVAVLKRSRATGKRELPQNIYL